MGYITVDDVRAESVPGDAISEASDAFIEARIATACADLESWTCRWFEPRDIRMLIDGTGARVLPLDPPIISIKETIILTGNPKQPLDITDIAADTVIYNRHLSQGLLAPDDRENPRIEIEFVRDARFGSFLIFPTARQNIVVDGTFGYTDPTYGQVISSAAEPFALADLQDLLIEFDGDPDDKQVLVTFSSANFVDITQASAAEVVAVINAALQAAGNPGRASKTAAGQVIIKSRTFGGTSSVEIIGGTAAGAFAFPPGPQGDPEGITPPLINRALLLMVVRDINPIGDEDHWNWANAHRLTQERIRDQSRSYGRGGGGGSGTGHQDTGFFTGDPEIDRIIARYVRPMDLGFVGGRVQDDDVQTGIDRVTRQWWGSGGVDW